MIDLIAVMVTVLLTGSELAIGVFVHPVLSKLQDAAHAEAAKPLARLLGRSCRFGTRPHCSVSSFRCSLTLSALGLGGRVIVRSPVPFSLICLVPINNRVAAWNLNSLPGDWKRDRRRWDHYHAIRIVMLVLASVAIVLAALFSQSGVA